jgi:hypothetical protein
LQALVQSSTPEELKVIDSIVRDYDEFSVFTNLSRKFAQGPSTLAETPRDAETPDDFKRSGLAWVMALARAELGAMYAGFTGQDDPFLVIGRPSPGELPAFKELLWDGARTHYWALGADPESKRASRAPATTPRYMAQGRRIVVAMAFMEAATSITLQELSPDQLKEAKGWHQELDELAGVYALKLADALSQKVATSTHNEGYTTLWSCPRLVKIATRKLGIEATVPYSKRPVTITVPNKSGDKTPFPKIEKR